MKTILLLAVLSSTFLWGEPQPMDVATQDLPEATENPVIKGAALVVLQTKCNVCHQKQNPQKVFTLDNMNLFATRINKQVFVKKRMPKGNDITLSQTEYDQIKAWLRSLDIQ